MPDSGPHKLSFSGFIVYCLFFVGGHSFAYAGNLSDIVEEQTQGDLSDPTQIDWSLCGSTTSAPQPQLPSQADEGDDRIHAQADHADMSDQKTTKFSGYVDIQQGRKLLEADYAEYMHDTDEIHATGHVRFTKDDLTIHSDSAQVNMTKEQGSFHNAEYAIEKSHVRGKAEHISIDSQNEEARLKNATYTTCPAGDTDWLLTGKTITLNNRTRQGVATQAVLEFMGLPLLYFPYYRFPIGAGRLTGFLAPSFGTSEKDGTKLKVPFYWNIAPERDATFTANYMSKRGTLWDTEIRYLNPNSYGQIDLGYLPHDEIRNINRELVSWRHQAKHGPNWSSLVDFGYLGDTEYLADFGGSLGTSSLTHVEQLVQLDYNDPLWAVTGRVQAHQTLSGTAPYQRFPQVLFTAHLPASQNQLNYNFNGEFVNFIHEESVTEGQRLDLQTGASLPLVHPGATSTPRLDLRYTGYNLSNVASGDPENPDRTLYTFTWDNQLFLERDSSLGEIPLLHTLEPRLQYLYIPKHEDNLPNFDSAPVDPSFNQLFEQNKFSGADILESTNHLSVGVTTRFYRMDTGLEILTASIGRQYLLSIQNDGQVQDGNQKNKIIANLVVRPTHEIIMNMDLESDELRNELEVINTRLQFGPYKKGVFNLAHRYTRNSAESIDGSFQWKINPSWQVYGRRYFDLVENKKIETLLGITYDTCCWAIRFFKRDSTTNNDKTVFIELVLKGLSSFLDQKYVGPRLSNDIPGYVP